MLQRTVYENMISSAIFSGFSCFLFFVDFNAAKKSTSSLLNHPSFSRKIEQQIAFCRTAGGCPDKTLTCKENSGQLWGTENISVLNVNKFERGYNPKVLPHPRPQLVLHWHPQLLRETERCGNRIQLCCSKEEFSTHKMAVRGQGGRRWAHRRLLFEYLLVRHVINEKRKKRYQQNLPQAAEYLVTPQLAALDGAGTVWDLWWSSWLCSISLYQWSTPKAL